MRKILALIVRPDSTGTLGRFTMAEIRQNIDGYLEGVGPNMGDVPWYSYCDEEGKLKGKPLNRAATFLAYATGWHVHDVLAGTVVFFGPADSDGNETDLTDEFIATAEAAGMFVGGHPDVITLTYGER